MGRTLGLGALRRGERSQTSGETLRIRYTLSDRYTLNKRDEREESSDGGKEDKRVFLHPECVASKSRSRMNASRRLEEGQKRKKKDVNLREEKKRTEAHQWPYLFCIPSPQSTIIFFSDG